MAGWAPVMALTADAPATVGTFEHFRRVMAGEAVLAVETCRCLAALFGRDEPGEGVCIVMWEFLVTGGAEIRCQRILSC